MDFENFAKKINLVREIETVGQLDAQKHSRFRFFVKNNSMVLEEIQKSKFSQINDKRYCFSEGIVSLPFSHPSLKTIIGYKEKNNKG